jgi:2,4-dienoyl-CoA reductase-like NADH-dependent reductase (Old Yellow Enzyme family)/thioredoxin reductase
MNTGYSTPDGLPTEKMFNYYQARAQGGVGLIIVEAAIIHPSARLHPHMLVLYDDRAIAGLQKLTAIIRASGTRVAIQLFHPGRQSTVQETGYQPIAPSPIPCPVCREMPRELSLSEIEEMIEMYISAAHRAKEAGFDMVELHGAHGYLINQFLSPHTNKRTDNYGGDLRARSLFVQKIILGIKEKLGNDFPLSCRINGADHVPGGLTLADTQALAPILESAGADVIHVSASVYGGYPSTIPPMAEKAGCFIPLAEGIKERINIPVITVGKIHDPFLAETTIQQNKADLIAMGRALIADPDLPNKILAGKIDEIRKCICCNQGCLDREHNIILPVAKPESDVHLLCMQNPDLGREFTNIPYNKISKKVMIIGGGPAGMAAAQSAALMGHEVSLYEEHQELGGQLLLAASPPQKVLFKEVIGRLSRELKKLGVKTFLGKRVTADLIREQAPQIVILATGALPIKPKIPGIEQANGFSAWEILQDKTKAGNKVLIIGGGQVGCETASFLADNGRKVTVVELLDQLATNMGRVSRWYLLLKLTQAGVEMLKGVTVKEIKDKEVIIETDGGRQQKVLYGFDTIVFAVGSKPRNELIEEVKGLGTKLYIVGDALKPRKALEAIYEGSRVVEMF